MEISLFLDQKNGMGENYRSPDELPYIYHSRFLAQKQGPKNNRRQPPWGFFYLFSPEGLKIRTEIKANYGRFCWSPVSAFSNHESNVVYERKNERLWNLELGVT